MRPWTPALLLAAVVGLAGCDLLAPPEECERPVTNAQGDAYRCTSAEDCPRSSNIPLCISDTGVNVECLGCRDTRCVRVSPEAC